MSWYQPLSLRLALKHRTNSPEMVNILKGCLADGLPLILDYKLIIMVLFLHVMQASKHHTLSWAKATAECTCQGRKWASVGSVWLRDVTVPRDVRVWCCFKLDKRYSTASTVAQSVRNNQGKIGTNLRDICECHCGPFCVSFQFLASQKPDNQLINWENNLQIFT